MSIYECRPKNEVLVEVIFGSFKLVYALIKID